MKNNAPQSKFWLLVGVALVMVVVLLAMVRFRHSGEVVPLSQCSPVYRHYAQVSGIEASFVKDFPLNDTVSIDVTLLHATTDPAWQRLKHDFGLDSLDPVFVDGLNEENFFSWFAPKSDYSKPIDAVERTNNDCISCSLSDNMICVFHINNIFQYKCIQYWQFKAMVNKVSLKTINNEEKNN